MLIETARRGAQRILQQALEAEVEAHLQTDREQFDEEGHRQVVRNGHGPQRTILTGEGPLELSRVRVDERKAIAADSKHESCFFTLHAPDYATSPSTAGRWGA